MKILALDASTPFCSVALMIDDTMTHLSQHAPRKHAQLILPMIDQILSTSGLSLSNLDALAFGAGPGSFTGVRITAGVIQGLSYATDLPVIPISTLAALAQNAYRTLSAEHMLSSLDARMNQVYWGVYKIDEQQIAQPLVKDCVADPKQVLIPTSNHWIGVGSGWEQYDKIFRHLLKDRLQNVYPQLFPDAQDIAYLARFKFQNGEYVFAENALPIYLREKVV
jgi:tRNA threonylcarbamoyladenosine biosynthesis protein TsaB